MFFTQAKDQLEGAGGEDKRHIQQTSVDDDDHALEQLLEDLGNQEKEFSRVIKE